MIERIEHANGVVTYQSPLLRGVGVKHAFATRIGGVPQGAYASLNLGNPPGCESAEDVAAVKENYQRLQMAIGLPLATRAWVTQVHGRMVELVESEGEGEYAETIEAEIRDRYCGQLEADALVTVEKNVLLTVRVADCLAVLLSSEDGRVVGAAHAGWRGVIGNVVTKTVRTMHEAGASPRTLVAAIGPAICGKCFEVGEEVAETFEKNGFATMVTREEGKKPHVDLQAVVTAQLHAVGVGRIDGNDTCTVENARDFFSHRRDNGVTGRMAAVIAAK